MARWKLDMKEHEATPERLYLRRGLAAPRPARRHVHRRLGPAARVRAVEAGPAYAVAALGAVTSSGA
jgi:hypothetical protein